MAAETDRRDAILAAAIGVFGRYGYRKTSVDDIARAADISKQGLYLHFDGKDAIFVAAIGKYLRDNQAAVERELARPGTPLFHRLVAAMDAWFGAHLDMFTPQSRDVIEAGDRLSGPVVEEFKNTFRASLAQAMAQSAEFKRTRNLCAPKDVAEVLFQLGLSWKDAKPTRAEFRKKLALAVRACVQVEA